MAGRKDFETFVDWYMAATGYKDNFTAATQIIGINPPPYINANALNASTQGVGAPE